MPRTELLEGRKHAVIPMVMLTVGTHSGSNGPIYYPAEELAASVEDWNGRPVVLFHPELHGRGVRAGDPTVTNQYKIGVIFNTSFNGHKLTAEAWIDLDRVSAMNADAYLAILNDKQMEVSTGLVTDYDTTNMVDGAPTARNYRPDHLALLPGKVGACSIAKGCGLARNGYDVSEYNDEEPLLMPSLFA